MESLVITYVVVAVFVLALLGFAVKFTFSFLSELRQIGAEGKTPASRDAGASPPEPVTGSGKSDLARALLAAGNIIVVPGFGLGVSQAQSQLGKLAKSLAGKGVNVSFAIHPAAGRMPGHMNVLLDAAEVPHAGIFDLAGINDRFPECDLALIVGANDVVNPAARDDMDHPNYGMPVLDADKARRVIVIKRGQGNGYSGIENPLFSRDNVSMVFGDARDILQNLLHEVTPHPDLPAGNRET